MASSAKVRAEPGSFRGVLSAGIPDLLAARLLQPNEGVVSPSPVSSEGSNVPEEREQVQLSLEVGGDVGAFVVGEFTLSGKVASWTQSLERDENVMVQLVDADGQVIFRSEGWVKTVAIETVPATQAVPRHTKRKHAIKLGESAPDSD